MNEKPVLKTPDPLITQEQLAAFAAVLLTNLILLFKLDITDGQQAALLGLVNSVYVVIALVHSAWVRYGRSRALLNPPKAQIEGSGTFVPDPLLIAPEDGDDRAVATKKKGGAAGA